MTNLLGIPTVGRVEARGAATWAQGVWTCLDSRQKGPVGSSPVLGIRPGESVGCRRVAGLPGLDQADFPGAIDGLQPVVDPELAVDRLGVGPDGTDGDAQLVSDVRTRQCRGK